MSDISAAELERDLRAGASVAVVDIRSEDDQKSWPLDGGATPVAALPAEELTELEPEAVAAIAGGRPLRLICTRGRTSAKAAASLSQKGIDATSVRGGMVAWARLLVPEQVDIGTDTTIVQFRREARGCLSYMVAAGGVALVVDPGPDVQPYLDEAERRDVRITAIFDTHVHADHLSGARELQERVQAKLHLSRRAIARGVRFEGLVEALGEGDQLGPAAADIRMIELPGHTSDNGGLLVDGRALISGDSLFTHAVARPELETGAQGAADAARTLHRTLHERVLSLPDDTLLLPCHYPGGRLEGPDVITIGEARKSLPLLSLDEDEFAQAVLSEMPPKPANFEQVIAFNLGAEDPLDSELLEVGANNCAAGPGSAG